MTVSVMKDNEKTRNRDPFIIKGMRGRIRLYWHHTHDLRDSDLMYRKDMDLISQKLLDSVNKKSLKLYRKGLK